jgi:5-methylcytosine-specific restriction endonuclease McrA
MNTFNCLHCNRENTVKRNNKNKFCDNQCQADLTMPKFYLGEVKDRRTLNKIITKLTGYKCACCSNNGIHNNVPLALQLDHIDGNAGNNMPENVRLLCPNCHSQTASYAAKNKGSGRGSRGLLR